MLDKKTVKKLMSTVPEGQVTTSGVSFCICPICKHSVTTFYPFADFVIAHEHPVRRYLYFLTTGRIYSKWLTLYWKDVEKYTGRTREDYAIS